MNIVIERNRTPHQPDPVRATERFQVPLPEGTSFEVALMRLWQVAMALKWDIASLADFPPRCYISPGGLYCAYLEVDAETISAITAEKRTR